MQIINKETQEYRESCKLISLGKLFKALDVEPTQMQLSLIRDFDERLEHWSYLTLAASRRSGKTFTVSIITVFELLKPNSSVILVSKSSKSLTANFNEIIKNLRLLGIKPDKINSNTYSLTIGNSHLRCAVQSQTENLLGAKASLIIIDEAGVYSYKEFMDQALLPMRIDYGSYEETKQFVSKVIRVSSPRTIGSDFFNDFERGLPPLFERHNYKRNDGYISKDGYISYRYNIYDSPLVTATLIESIKANTDEDIWKTEYLCEFIHASAVNVFPHFDKTISLYDRNELYDKLKAIGKTHKLQGFIGVDIGLIDNMAVVVGTIIDNSIYILDSHQENMITTSKLAEIINNFKDKWENHDKLPLAFDEGATYIDPSAALTRYDLATDYEVENLPAFNKIKEGINDINTLFEHKRLFIPYDQDALIQQIELLAYKDAAVHSLNATTSGDPFVRLKGHHFDIVHAFRYLCASITRYWGYGLETNDDEL